MLSTPPFVLCEIMPQLSPEEQNLVDKIVRKDKGTPMEAWREINKARQKAKQKPLEHSAVYRYVRGETHERGAVETRGRKRALSKSDVRSLQATRRRLIKEADSEERVTYADIMENSTLENLPSQKVVEEALRADGVSFKPPRKKIQIDADDAKLRLAVAKKWIKHPPRHWSSCIYVDNKNWLLWLTEKQRKRYKQTRITGHLRTAKEGVERGFTKPRDKHCWIGMPSVTITAAVARDKVVMWRVQTGWNGSIAADMYKKQLLPALKRTWGNKRQFTIVEDGDKKGNQSNKGIAAKEASGILAMTLPPRTPSLMPLDYAIWEAIDDKMVETAPTGRESKKDFLKRLSRCARGLPKGFVARQIKKMRANLQGIIDAKGWHPKND